jgi:hypothetical protein
VKLTTQLQLLPRTRIRGFIDLLPHTPSWRSVKLVKHRKNLTFKYKKKWEDRKKTGE